MWHKANGPHGVWYYSRLDTLETTLLIIVTKRKPSQARVAVAEINGRHHLWLMCYMTTNLATFAYEMMPGGGCALWKQYSWVGDEWWPIMTSIWLMPCGLWIQRPKDGPLVRWSAAAETMAASQRHSQPIGVVLGDDVQWRHAASPAVGVIVIGACWVDAMPVRRRAASTSV